MSRHLVVPVSILVGLSLTNTAFAQVSEGGLPPTWDSARPTYKVGDPPEVLLPPVDLQPYLDEDRANEGRKDLPLRFGVNRPVSLTPDDSGEWTQLTDGSWLWRLQIRSPGAEHLNLRYSAYELPPGAELYLYSADHRQQIGAFTDKNNHPTGQFGTMMIRGDTTVLEYWEPADVAFPGRLTIDQVTHGYRNVFEMKTDKAFGDSDPCEVNVACDPANIDGQIRSTVQITLNNGLCTGTLVNNTAQDGRPYVLTADHCTAGEPNPATWVMWFNWESATCSNPGSSPVPDTLTGAVIRANRADSDFSLLELSSTPPLAYNPYYAGWDASGLVPASTYAIHHPAADIKKISRDADSPGTTTIGGLGVNEFWEIGDWESGVTEGGSSGGALFDPNGRVIGQLYGGLSFCSGPAGPDYYGKLSVSWDGDGTQATRLSDWLDPLNTNPGFIDGYDPNLPTAPDNVGLISIDGPLDGGFECDADVATSITFRNNGSNDLNSAELGYRIDGGALVTQIWTGTLAPLESTSIVLGTDTLADGTHTVDVSLALPNNTTDSNPADNLGSATFDVLDTSGIGLPLTEDFEAGPLPPVGWQLQNDNGLYTWEQSTTVGGYSNSNSSAFYDNYNNDETGELDVLYTPLLDFSGVATADVSWDLAYAAYTSAEDGFGVYASRDCGQTFDEVYYDQGAGLSTAPAQGTEFAPAADQWRTDSVDLSAYVGEDDVMLAFVSYPGFGNSLFLDNISVNGVDPTELDAGITAISPVDGDVSCDPDVAPVVELSNLGGVSLSSVDIYWSIDGGAASLFTWTGSLAAGATQLVSLPASVEADGVHTLDVFTDNPNGATDDDPSNDAGAQTSFETYDVSGGALPLVEGFEAGLFPPTDWVVDNQDGDTAWERTTAAGGFGSSAASAFFDNYNTNAVGTVDALISPLIDA